MAGGMEGYRDAPDLKGLAKGQGLGRNAAKAVADHGQGLRSGQIVLVSGAGVVGMAVGDQGPRYRSPGVNVKTPVRAKKALWCKGKKVRAHSAKGSAPRKRRKWASRQQGLPEYWADF